MFMMLCWDPSPRDHEPNYKYYSPSDKIIKKKNGVKKELIHFCIEFWISAKKDVEFKRIVFGLIVYFIYIWL